ncbi:glycoside hydrolase family 3 N-terminal domain-containing protein [Bacteroides sp. 519]|uniref:glycoside hydrolase family 3 N-terminal domain-containing protein n=1 Tax=Bacteroides sp. 519 TaxID=2302937 RepID=UPI0013D6D80E|nr:glycoside hydrolase family 3 N-terminal domain-containing protein [Bacteroides sp. 519]NDV60325.1 beta-glucosidase [Bacteroides sp. 519]
MRKYFLSLVAVTLMTNICAQQSNVRPAIPQDKKMEQTIESLLKKMTLEEKIGQMTQLTIDVVGKGMNIFHTVIPFEFNEALLDTVIHKYKIGSILNVPGSTPQTRQEWTDIITRLQKEAIAETGIPLIYGVDQIHGTTYTVGGTLFPQNVNLGATFNRALSAETGRISAYETKAGNIPWTFAPVLDLGRDARWPRMWETFSEDAYLTSELGREMVIGFQGGNGTTIGKDYVAACLKHYMGYSVPASGKDRTPSYITEYDMREKHFVPHLEAIRAGALSVMVNSAVDNGIPFHANYKYLTQWLKEDLNWDGVIVTDWADINNIYMRDRVAATKKEAIKMAINAGIDMSMDPYSWDFCVLLKQLVEEGEVSMTRIDDAVSRVLRMKFRLGLFDKPYWNIQDYPDFGSEKHAQAALAAAEESITLLKNDENILPLTQGKKILITGPNANSMRSLNGGWSYTWQGDRADEFAADHNTILEAFQNKAGSQHIVYEPGVTYKARGSYWEENTPEIEKAVAAARNVDVIVACIGENSYCETPGNLDDLTLSKNQLDLVKALATTGKPIILVLNEGRPRIINEIVPLAKAVVHIYLPGNHGGDALAKAVYGDVNPSGKLPYTYPRHANSLITYDYKPSQSQDRMQGAYDYNAVVSVQWAFGYGLSYTTFTYSNLKVNKSSFSANDELTFTVDVKNTGSVAGKESILLFTSDLVASSTPDVRRLRAFDKVDLKPGESKTVTLKVKGSDLAFVGADGKWTLEAGDFDVQVGNQLLRLNCPVGHKWENPNK